MLAAVVAALAARARDHGVRVPRADTAHAVDPDQVLQALAERLPADLE
jgi:hypothetical protein